MCDMFPQRNVLISPTAQCLFAEETFDIVWFVDTRFEDESCFRKLKRNVSVKIYSCFVLRADHMAIRTSTADRFLCGHSRAFGALELAVDVRRLLMGCGPWKEANLCSNTKKCSSAMVMITTARSLG